MINSDYDPPKDAAPVEYDEQLNLNHFQDFIIL